MSATTQSPVRSSERSTDLADICVIGTTEAAVSQYERTLEGLGFGSWGSCNPEEALAIIARGRCRVVLYDVKPTNRPADGHVRSLLAEARRLNSAIQVIVLADAYSPEAAIEAIKQGACDYLPKPVQREHLKATLDDLAREFRQEKRAHQAEQLVTDQTELCGFVGRSPAILETIGMARRIARHYTTVMLTGPRGAGKQHLARVIRQLSPVADGLFAICHFAAQRTDSAQTAPISRGQEASHRNKSIPEEEEKKGRGLLQQAEAGTLFLNDVANVPSEVQADVYRVLQGGRLSATGTTDTRQPNVRLIVATSHNLRGEVMAGRFRQDLFNALSALELRLPSLAERREDIPLLTAHFLKKFNENSQLQIDGVTLKAQTALLRYAWPGNVGELEQVIANACRASVSGQIDLEDLPNELRSVAGEATSRISTHPLPLKEICKEHIERALEMCNGNRVRTAQALGIGRTSLYRYLKRRRSRSASSAGVQV